jgi:ubiquinone/menaquinone biosynthesis C-methylase UbiE
MADNYGGLSTRYVYHNIDEILGTLSHKDEFGNLEIGNHQIKILDVGCGQGTWAYHLRAKYPEHDLHISGFDFQEDSIEFSQNRNIYDNIGYFNYEDKLPFQNNTIDLILAIGFINNKWEKSHVENFLSEVKRVSHNAIITIPSKIIPAKQLKKDGEWFIRSFGFNFPKNRKPTTFDHFMEPITFGLSKYNTYWWAKEYFCLYGGEKTMAKVERSIMGKEKVVREE